MNLLFDIGASHMRVSIANENGIGDIMHADTPMSPEDGVDAFAKLAGSFGGEFESITGGLAAVIKDGSVLTSTNLPGWKGFHFAAALEQRLRAPVMLMNDAELNGLGEAVSGAGQGARVVAYIGLGTGVGTSRIIDGIIDPYSSGGAARDGIITLLDGSTLEERIGGHSLEARYGAGLANLPEDMWRLLIPALAEGVNNALRLWGPDVVVLGGALMNEQDGFKLADVLLELPSGTPVVAGTLHDTSGLWGARALAV